MYLCDTHTHSRISPDCTAALEETAAAAVRFGLSDFYVTDHCDLLDGNGQPNTSFDWPAAKAQFHSVGAGLNGSMGFHLGIELGSAPFDPETARRILREGGDELDFVLGSLHNWIGLHGNIDFFISDFSASMELCREMVDCYMEHTWTLVTECADCYDSLAHIVYPFRYIRRDGQHLPVINYEDQIRRILTEVARTDHALEVNTCRGTDMAYWSLLLNWFKDCGGRLVTVGTDAHEAADVGKTIPLALELVQAAGFSYVTTYEKRRPILHKL